MISYRCTLDVPRELVLFVSGLLAARRREIGTRKGTRKLTCYRQAVFGLASQPQPSGTSPGLAGSSRTVIPPGISFAAVSG